MSTALESHQFTPAWPEAIVRLERARHIGGVGSAYRDCAERLRRPLEEHAPGGKRALVLGAGAGHDLPLEELSRRYDSLRLVDVDSEALELARSRLDPEPARHVHLLAEDVTGTIAATTEALAAGFSDPRHLLPSDRLRALAGVLDESATSRVFPEEWEGAFDLVASTLLLSQLGRPVQTVWRGLVASEVPEVLEGAATPQREALGELEASYRRWLEARQLEHLTLIARLLIPGGRAFLSCTSNLCVGPLWRRARVSLVARAVLARLPERFRIVKRGRDRGWCSRTSGVARRFGVECYALERL